MEFIYNDGGRKAAGYKGRTRDCVCRSIAIITEQPYATVYSTLNTLGMLEREGSKNPKKRSSARTGVYPDTTKFYLKSLGYTWIPVQEIGGGCKMHLRKEELPAGRLIVKVSRHLTAVIDGVIYDAHDPSRNGRRCVYGYFQKL